MKIDVLKNRNERGYIYADYMPMFATSIIDYNTILPQNGMKATPSIAQQMIDLAIASQSNAVKSELKSYGWLPPEDASIMAQYRENLTTENMLLKSELKKAKNKIDELTYTSKPIVYVNWKDIVNLIAGLNVGYSEVTLVPTPLINIENKLNIKDDLTDSQITYTQGA